MDNSAVRGMSSVITIVYEVKHNFGVIQNMDPFKYWLFLGMVGIDFFLSSSSYVFDYFAINEILPDPNEKKCAFMMDINWEREQGKGRSS